VIKNIWPPVPVLHNTEFTVSLDGVDYIVLLTWNARVSRWFYRLTKEDGTQVHGDRKLVADIPLHNHLVGENFPPGALWSVTTDATDPSFSGVQSNFSFVYVDKDNLG
jgi:hypothetical protein